MGNRAGRCRIACGATVEMGIDSSVGKRSIDWIADDQRASGDARVEACVGVFSEETAVSDSR